MSDASGLTPEQEAVRRLLAEARHDGPVPPEVVSRLDETLASLVAERASERSLAPVVDLGARRRRLAGIGLLAAAAVVVAGVAIGQGLPSRSGSDDTSASSAGDQSDSAPAEVPESDTDGGEDSGGAASETGPGALKSVAPLAGVPTVSSADVDLDSELVGVRSDAATRSQQLGSADALSNCELPRLGQGRRLVAEVDGQPGVIVFRRPDGAAQQAEIYVCGTPEPVRTLSLPAP
jgi:hypothetical protein